MYQLKTEKSKKVIDPLSSSMLIYGDHGVGKTSLTAQMEGAYFLATEAGHDFVEIMGDDVLDWDMFKAMTATLLKSKHPYSAVILDSISALWDLCVDHTCTKKGMSHPADLEWSRGWDYCKKAFREEFNALTKSRLGVICTAQEDSENRGTKQSPSIYYFPRVTGSCKQVSYPVINYIGRMYVVHTPKGGEMVSKRYISFKENKSFYARDRDGILRAASPICLEPEENAWLTIRKVLSHSTKE